MLIIFYRILLIIFLASHIELTTSERLHDQIYSNIEGTAACFRRLNGTHQAGCSSSDKGSVGTVHIVKHLSDGHWVVQNGTSPPYMAVVSTALFSDVIELFIKNANKISGILLFDNASSSVTSFTQESKCPNEYSSGPGSTCSSKAGGVVWNNKGTGLLRRHIPFPIFFLPKSKITEVDKIEQCFNKYNIDKINQKGRPLCALQLHSFMYAAVDSVVCLRRSATSALMNPTKLCDPLKDRNIYYPLFPLHQAQQKNVTLVTARIDTATLFDGVSPGAASSVVGMVTLITAAATLSKMIPASDVSSYDNNILWTLFTGEAFDYIGSQRVAYDISRGAWPPAAPLSPASLRLHAELGQLGGSVASNTTWPLYAFIPYDTLPAEVDQFIQMMSENLLLQNNMTINTIFSKNLPPSSLHSFRRILKNETESGDFPEVLFVDHGETFTNKYYHSALDTYDKIGFNYHNISIDNKGTFLTTEELLKKNLMMEYEPQVKVAYLATALTRTLYQLVTGNHYDGDMAASAHMVDELLYCFTQNVVCQLLAAAEYARPSFVPREGEEETGEEGVLPLYVGVGYAGHSPSLLPAHLLALLTGAYTNYNYTQCGRTRSPDFAYHWLKGWNHTGVCIQTTMNFSQALSPAFIIPDYSFDSGEYSTWTESAWQAMWARVFVRGSGRGSRLAAAAGAPLTLLAALLTYRLYTRARHLFPPSVAGSDTASASGILRTANC